eukprot:SAG25_NODE_1956_length_2101_cov_21.696304_1_plen_24_part_10
MSWDIRYREADFEVVPAHVFAPGW